MKVPIKVTLYSSLIGLTFGAITYILKKHKKKIIPTFVKEISRSESGENSINHFFELPTENWIDVGKVEKLCIYPIMFGKAREVQGCIFNLRNMSVKDRGRQKVQDKMFVVYNEKTNHIQTQNLMLSLVKIKAAGKNRMQLQAIGMPKLIFKIESSDKKNLVIYDTIPCIICTTSETKIATIPCLDCGEEVAQWLSKFLIGKNSGLRLGYRWTLLTFTKMHISQEEEQVIMGPFMNPNCFSMISESSLNKINFEMQQNMIYQQFRPNIVISTSVPFAEDKWKWIKIGDAIFKNVKPTSRFYNEIDLQEISVGLRLKLMLINCELHYGGTVKIGDSVTVYIPDV